MRTACSFAHGSDWVGKSPAIRKSQSSNTGICAKFITLCIRVLLPKKLFIMNLFLNSSQLSTLLSSYECLWQLLRWKRQNSWLSGFCIVTIHLPSHINFSKGTFGQKVNASCETFTVLIWSGHIWIFHVPKIKNHLEKIVYWITWRHLISCDDSTKRTFDKWSSPEFPVMAGMLECMYKARRWLSYVFTESVW